MILRDENIRIAVTDCLTRAHVDARNLAVEIREGVAHVEGSVPTQEQQARLYQVLYDQIHDFAIVPHEVRVGA